MKQSPSSFFSYVCPAILSLAVALFVSPGAVFSHEKVSGKVATKMQPRKGPYVHTVKVDYGKKRLTLLGRGGGVIFVTPIGVPKYFPKCAPSYGEVKLIEYWRGWTPTDNIRKNYFRRYKRHLDSYYPPSRAKPNVIGNVFMSIRWITPCGDYNVGIHGNNDPTKIGFRVSAGCIRMYNKAWRKLAKFIDGKRTRVIFGYFGSSREAVVREWRRDRAAKKRLKRRIKERRIKRRHIRRRSLFVE